MLSFGHEKNGGPVHEHMENGQQTKSVQTGTLRTARGMPRWGLHIGVAVAVLVVGLVGGIWDISMANRAAAQSAFDPTHEPRRPQRHRGLRWNTILKSPSSTRVTRRLRGEASCRGVARLKAPHSHLAQPFISSRFTNTSQIRTTCHYASSLRIKQDLYHQPHKPHSTSTRRSPQQAHLGRRVFSFQ